MPDVEVPKKYRYSDAIEFWDDDLAACYPEMPVEEARKKCIQEFLEDGKRPGENVNVYLDEQNVAGSIFVIVESDSLDDMVDFVKLYHPYDDDYYTVYLDEPQDFDNNQE